MTENSNDEMHTRKSETENMTQSANITLHGMRSMQKVTGCVSERRETGLFRRRRLSLCDVGATSLMMIGAHKQHY